MDPFSGTCKRIDLGGFTGSRLGRGEEGVDFEEDTVDEVIVIALPEDGGIVDLGAGVCVEEGGFSSDFLDSSTGGFLMMISS